MPDAEAPAEDNLNPVTYSNAGGGNYYDNEYTLLSEFNKGLTDEQGRKETPKNFYWYYDGELARVYEGDGVAKGSAGMRLLIQLAPEYKDGWGGTYDPTGYPYQMKTDYIKAYQFK